MNRFRQVQHMEKVRTQILHGGTSAKHARRLGGGRNPGHSLRELGEILRRFIQPVVILLQRGHVVRFKSVKVDVPQAEKLPSRLGRRICSSR